ncbi:hypothetical protein [Vibrio sp. CAU 1672]|uniref:hypothetical protein n=1 Tax=Vibrio sp. CAU 1672 TaxID=3032594 RepID=UPI0023DBB2BB|nr:hypothetical protein [Vibrio sp. CAU 1672]MDF2155155.1 hypothetical protein [Vibrio sp. CAU 1672]
MVTRGILSALLWLAAVQTSIACSYLSDRSVVFSDNTQEVCEEVLDSIANAELLHWEIAKSQAEGPVKSYWEQWAIQSADTPLITQNLEKNYFGLGIWMPDELRAEERDMSTEEWLKNHGLLFSVGFGNKTDGEPRMRFDYRWHELYDADWMMQIEVPF